MCQGPTIVATEAAASVTNEEWFKDVSNVVLPPPPQTIMICAKESANATAVRYVVHVYIVDR